MTAVSLLDRPHVLPAAATCLDCTPVSIEGSRLPPPVISYLGNRRWRLERTYRYKNIEIPFGFVFDLASIPRILWWLIAPFELSIVAVLIHDGLYRVGGHTPEMIYTRHEVDKLFREIMELEQVEEWRRVLAYRTVRLIGWRFWNGD